MTLEQLLKATARRLGTPYETLLKDYAIGHALSALASEDSTAEALVMKGGTALRKLYFGDYRFSEDLDFSAIGGPRGAELEGAFRSVAARMERNLSRSARFRVEAGRVHHSALHPRGQEDFVIRVQYPWQSEPLCVLKAEVTVDEGVLLPTVARPILHGYGEELPGTIRAYSLEEVLAEKLRALLQNEERRSTQRWVRPRSRDFYDLWRILTSPPVPLDRAALLRILPAKCAARDVTFSSSDSFFPEELLVLVRREWETNLSSLVTDLPPAEEVIRDLRAEVRSLLGETGLPLSKER